MAFCCGILTFVFTLLLSARRAEKPLMCCSNLELEICDELGNQLNAILKRLITAYFDFEGSSLLYTW